DSDQVFIDGEGHPLTYSDFSKITMNLLSKTNIDTSQFKSHSTRTAMATLLLQCNVPLHTVKKLGRWRTSESLELFYDKEIIGLKSEDRDFVDRLFKRF
ncbi:hypothetical protein SAMD00019534_126790, partial [Acytostelium subglobosum LB1]